MRSLRNRAAALGIGACIAIPLMAAPSAVAAVPAGPEPVDGVQADTAGDFRTRTISCSSGNFTGTAVVSHRWRDEDSSWTAIDVEIEQYKIHRVNEQSGGDKANVNLSLDTYYGSGHTDYGWVRSADSMKQDGQWHDLSLGMSGHSSRYSDPRGSARVTVEFVFDRSGPDPRCKTTFTDEVPA